MLLLVKINLVSHASTSYGRGSVAHFKLDNAMDFKDIFKPPFSTDDYGIYMFDANNNICLEYNPATTYNETIMHQIAKILNGEDTLFSYDINKATVTKNANDCFIIFENGDVITVRSWGYLTGVKHLSNKDAAKVQDSFLDYIVNKIKESQK